MLRNVEHPWLGRQYRLVGLTLLMVVLVTAAACSRGVGSDGDSGNVTIDIEVTPDPPAMGPADIILTLTDSDGEPISGADLEIEGNMSHAGMEPVMVGADAEQNGRYVSDGFAFTMGGDWIITVTGTLPDGEEIRQTFDLKGVSS